MQDTYIFSIHLHNIIIHHTIKRKLPHNLGFFLYLCYINIIYTSFVLCIVLNLLSISTHENKGDIGCCAFVKIREKFLAVLEPLLL